MATPFKIKRSAVEGKRPTTTDIELGELALNFYDGYLFAERDTKGVGIGTTVALLTPWTENFGAASIYYSNSVGIGTTSPTQLLDVAGDIRLRGAIYDSNNTVGTANQVLVSRAGAGITWANLTAIPVGDANTLDGLDSTQFLRSDVADTKAGITTFSDEVILQSNLNVTGVSTFSDDVILQSNLNVTGVVTATTFFGSLTGTATTATRVRVSESGSQTDHFVMLARESTTDSAVRLDAGLKFHTGTNSLTITGETVIGAGVSIVGVATASAFVGDGSGLTNLPGGSIGIDTNTTNQAQLLTYAVSYGSTTGLGATDGLVYNPSSGRMGIGSDAPAYSLDVAGDINSSTDVKINGTGVLDTALALAIALG